LEVKQTSRHVGFAPKSGHRWARSGCPDDIQRVPKQAPAQQAPQHSGSEAISEHLGHQIDERDQPAGDMDAVRPTGIHLVAQPRKTVATVRVIARSMLHMLRTVSGHIATVPQPIVTI
jgi:hypothetical protein